MRATHVVRDRVYGEGKFHLLIAKRVTYCGLEPSCPGEFPLRGERDEFERHCADHICKRCLKAEAA